MHVVCMCMTVVKYNLLTAASVSVSAPEAASSILGHKRGCMLLVCVLHVATSVLDCLYSLLISSILVPDVLTTMLFPLLVLLNVAGNGNKN